MNPDPFDLPVQKLEFTCKTERPVAFWPWDHAAAPFEVLIERALGAPPPGRVYFRVLDDLDSCPQDDFVLEVTLWGRRAIAARDEIRAAVHRLGEELHDPVAFTLEEREPLPARSLREIADDLPRMARQLTLTIESPLDVEGDVELVYRGNLPFDFPELVADSARRLARFDIEDREGVEVGLDVAAHEEEAAREAAAVVDRLEWGFSMWEGAWVDPEDLAGDGSNVGDSGDDERKCIGWLGHCEFEFPSPEVWPWFLALALGRGGRRLHEGFGAFSLWARAGP